MQKERTIRASVTHIPGSATYLLDKSLSVYITFLLCKWYY